MAVVKNNYVKPGKRERANAKASIRYIQHRPGRTAEHAQHAQHHHRDFFCCGQFAENCEILGMSPTLDLALSPDYCRYHSRYCETFTAYYRDALFARAGENTPRQDKVLAPQPATEERKAAPESGNGRERITRTLFSWDGAMERKDAYRMIDEAAKGSVFYRFVLSPDPKTEDTKRDLSLRRVTETMMHSLEEHIHKQVTWVGAIHADHAPHRHVHILAIVPGRLQRQEFAALPQVLRGAATQDALEQRHELDLAWGQQVQVRGEAAWECSY